MNTVGLCVDCLSDLLEPSSLESVPDSAISGNASAIDGDANF